MPTNNSFKKLLEEESRKHPHPPPETEMGVMGTTRVIRFMTDVVELYLPRIFDVFIALVGGSSDDEKAPKASSRGASEADSGESPRGDSID